MAESTTNTTVSKRVEHETELEKFKATVQINVNAVEDETAMVKAKELEQAVVRVLQDGQ